MILFHIQKYVNIISIIQNPKGRNKLMNRYLTPLKQNNQNNQHQIKILSQPREGDWVCYNCNNLNFSFRMKCNRCKTQTREQNQQVTAYYFNYYPKEYCFGQEKENFAPLQTQQLHCLTNSQRIHNNKCKFNFNLNKNHNNEHTPQRTRPKQQLPSVSLLVKRYNRHENNSTQESKNQGLFENEGLWANIDLKYLAEVPKMDNAEPSDDENQEIQKIIQRIML